MATPPWRYFTTGFPTSSRMPPPPPPTYPPSIEGLPVWAIVTIALAAVVLLVLAVVLLIVGCRYCCCGGQYGARFCDCDDGCCDCCGCCYGNRPYKRKSLFGRPVKTQVYEVPGALAPMSSHLGWRGRPRNLDRPVARQGRFGRRKVVTEYIDDEPDFGRPNAAFRSADYGRNVHVSTYQPSLFGAW